MVKKPLIKICGITSEKEIGYVSQAGIDYAGFVLFFPKSKRNLSIERAKELIAKLPNTIRSVAVTVSPTKEQVLAVTNAGFSAIQIHGKVEDSLISSCRIPVLKAFNVSDMDAFSHYEQMDEVVGFVMDAAVPGSGKTFDWNLLKKLPVTEKLILLAGGLNPENVREALDVCGEKIDGVDTSSGVECADGNGKSKERIEAFVRAVRGNK